MDYNMDKRLRNFATPDSIDVPYSEIMEKNYNLFPFTYMEHLPEETNHDSLVQIVQSQLASAKLSNSSIEFNFWG